jgi:hypothetical protein
MRLYALNYVPTTAALIFIRDGETITLRSFTKLTPTEALTVPVAPSAEIERVVRQPGIPFREGYFGPKIAYPGYIFQGSHDADAMYCMTDALCWTPDPVFLGTSAVSDRSAWVFMVRPDNTLISPFNRTIETLPTRAHYNSVYMTHQANSVLTICQPYANSALDDCTVFVKYAEHSGYRHNFGEATPYERESPPVTDSFPELRLVGPETIVPSDTVTVTVEVLAPITREVDTRCNSTLYLEDVDGYAPSLRVKVTDGVGSFRASADGLQPGDRMRIKVGWRNWPGEVEYSPLVV